jgi:hypothetical protein
MVTELNENIKDYFNRVIRDKEWNKNKDIFQTNFLGALILLDTTFRNERFPVCYLEKTMYRLNLGYSGIGRIGGITTKLKSIDSINLPSSKKTDDHVFGASEIGRHIRYEFEKYNMDIDYMVNTWLYDNLYLWAKIKVSKEEHKKDNIARNKHTIEEKVNLLHYTNVSKIVF